MTAIFPKGFPKLRVPVNYPMTTAKVELGRDLFLDRRISANHKTSCATRHGQELAFNDGRSVKGRVDSPRFSFREPLVI